MQPRRSWPSTVWHHIRENSSGRPQQARFDAMSEAQRTRQGLLSWLLLSGIFAAVAMGMSLDPLWPWLIGSVLLAGPIALLIFRYGVRKSEQRRGTGARRRTP